MYIHETHVHSSPESCRPTTIFYSHSVFERFMYHVSHLLHIMTNHTRKVQSVTLIHVYNNCTCLVVMYSFNHVHHVRSLPKQAKLPVISRLICTEDISKVRSECKKILKRCINLTWYTRNNVLWHCRTTKKKSGWPWYCFSDTIFFQCAQCAVPLNVEHTCNEHSLIEFSINKF